MSFVSTDDANDPKSWRAHYKDCSKSVRARILLVDYSKQVRDLSYLFAWDLSGDEVWLSRMDAQLCSCKVVAFVSQVVRLTLRPHLVAMRAASGLPNVGDKLVGQVTRIDARHGILLKVSATLRVGYGI